MPSVLLVRHGQASFGAADYDVLSDAGRAQARAVGAELQRRGVQPVAAASGTVRRQRDTALEAGLDAVVDGRWDEYDSEALLTRYAASALPQDSRAFQQLLDDALLAWQADPDGGWDAFAGGTHAALGELAAGLTSGQDAVVLTSGGVVAALCGRLLGAPPQTVVALNRVMVNASITKVVAGRGGLSLVSFNDHAHLPPATVTYR